jgi:hypothetical protein
MSDDEEGDSIEMLNLLQYSLEKDIEHNKYSTVAIGIDTVIMTKGGEEVSALVILLNSILQNSWEVKKYLYKILENGGVIISEEPLEDK